MLAIIITRVALNGTVGSGEPIDGEFCYTRIWQYHDGKMKIVSGHCSSAT